jgi:hypothetical protein
VEVNTEDFNPSLSPGNDGGKVLVEKDGKNGGGKGRIRKIIHGPAKDLTL